jgi:hypothetical protein
MENLMPPPAMKREGQTCNAEQQCWQRVNQADKYDAHILSIR